MDTLARYDSLAEWYESFRGGELSAPELEALERLLGRGPGRCLDLGCGTGVAIPALAALGWSVVGTDVSGEQLRFAESRAAETGAELVRADAARLPFADRSFDAVVSLLTHTDFDDFARVVGEVERVLAPGGRFVYVGPHPCFVCPTFVRRDDGTGVLHPGYRRRGWWREAIGFRFGREGIRGRAGVNHLPLADFLNAVAAAGLVLERVEEPGTDDLPLLLALVAVRPPSATVAP
jgi:SAM-dependent methyltransferase